MNLAAEELRYTAAYPTSMTSPSLPIGVRPRIFSLRLGSPSNALRLREVSNHPGAMALTRTPWGENSTARALVKPDNADLAAL